MRGVRGLEIPFAVSRAGGKGQRETVGSLPKRTETGPATIPRLPTRPAAVNLRCEGVRGWLGNGLDVSEVGAR